MPLRLPSPDISALRDHALDTRDSVARRGAYEMPRSSFVSAGRVHQVLRARFGSRPTGERGPGYIYWQTAEGVMFPLEDPLAVPGSKPILRADGTEQLCYSYGYVISLLRRVDEAERVAREERSQERTPTAPPHSSRAVHTTRN